MKEASESAIAQLRSIYEKPRSKLLLEIAINEFRLPEATITVSGGVVTPAARFCVDVNYNMNRFVPLSEIPTDSAERERSMWKGIKDPQESYQIAALLLTIERMTDNTWGFGNRLRFILERSGFRLTNYEWNALMAQECTYTTSPFDKKYERMFWNAPIAIALYAGEFYTACGTLHNIIPSEKEIPENVMKMFSECIQQNPRETMEKLLQTFLPIYLGEAKETQIKNFMGFLDSRGFYNGPASENSYGNFDAAANNGIGGGLLIHSIDVLYQQIEILRPQSPIEMAFLVLLAVCNDLSEIGAYQRNIVTEPVNGPAYQTQNGQFVKDKDGKYVVDRTRTHQWPDKTPYHMNSRVVFQRKETSVEPGAKSMYLALWAFNNGSLTEDVCSAICNSKRDFKSNCCCDDLMIKNILCRTLHLADFLASMTGRKMG